MLGKLFKRKSVPENSGEMVHAVAPRLKYRKVFELQLSNMEDSPVYELTHQLSIGSEIGNIVVADPSISPRHATFILQQDVVSVIDHGSIGGTLVNGSKIPTGKYIILEETDTIQVGDLEVKLNTSNISEEIVEEVPEIPEEEEEVEEKVVSPAKTPSKKAAKVIAIAGPEYATNSIVRVLAVLCDGLLAYSLLVILHPFDEVRSFLDFIPEFALSLVEADWNGIWEAFTADYAFVGAMFEDAVTFFSNTLHPGPLIVMFMLVRLVSTLIFGVSISELLLGVRAKGNVLWKRIGGGLRVLIGMITGPFVVFDISSVISRRTFKEFLTFTHTYINSKFWTIVGTICLLPLMISLALIAPLIQGFDLPRAITVNEKIDQRVKVRQQPGVTPETVQTISEGSNYLNLELTYDPATLAIIPQFKFQGVRNKIALKSGLQFYQKDLFTTVGFEVYKTFDLKELLGIGMRGNVFLYDKFPHIYSFVYSAEESNPAFRKTETPTTHLAFANEMIEFIKMSFSLDAENALERMQTDTFLIKGLIDFKASFQALIEYKDFDEVGFIKIGNTIFMKISFMKQKPFDILMPLIKDEGRLFKVNFPGKENQAAVASKFYKYNLEKSNWIPQLKRNDSEVMHALQVVDLFSTPKLKTIPQDKAQALYGYYFEASSAVLSHGDPILVEVWKNDVKSLLKILEALPNAPEDETIMKLQQNFKDLLDALESKNMEYFGASQTTSV